MAGTTRDFVALGDVAAAVGLLSRIPVPLDPARAQARGARAAWAWPLAGALFGGMAAGIGSAALWLGIAPMLAAALALAGLIVITGAMHEDGLADCADGFWGGWERARRLEIMKDSHIGAYGVLAIGLALILRWQAIGMVFEAGAHWPVLVAVGALSRAPMVALMAALPPAREGGLSRAVGRPSVGVAAAAALLALAIGLALLGLAVVPVAAAVAVLALGWAALCRAKIGGQTGDTLGGVQQVCEIGALLAVTATVV